MYTVYTTSQRNVIKSNYYRANKTKFNLYIDFRVTIIQRTSECPNPRQDAAVYYVHACDAK